MDWLKLYTSLPDDEKLIDAGDEAGWHLHGWLYVCGLCYCAEQETDGRIPKAQVPRLSTVPGALDLAAGLVDAGLWRDEGRHFVVHGYTERQSTKEQMEAARRARSEGGRKGAAKRWGNGSPDGPTDGGGDGPTHDSTHDSTHSPANGSSSLVSSSLPTAEGQNGPVAPARAHARAALVPELVAILNRIPGDRRELTELDDSPLVSAMDAHPSVDPIQAANSAVARDRQNVGRLDAFLRELRALETRAERTREREQHKPDAAVIHKLATNCRDCGRELKAASDRASGTCQACDEKRLEGAA